MVHNRIKALFNSAVSSVASGISGFTFHPEKDLTRTKKLPAATLLRFLVSQGASSTRTELMDFFGMDTQAPSASALNQQRAKLKATALEAVFRRFSTSVDALHPSSGYRFLAVDGSSFTFFSTPRFASPEYFVSGGHSAKGFYSMHLTALYDLERRTYTDAVLQPVHEKDEFRAFCTMVDRQEISPGIKYVYPGDRGFCSWNCMAHVRERGQYFLFRSKDIHSKGITSRFHFPGDGSFDTTVRVTLVRSHSKKIPVPEGSYRRFVDKKTAFDYIEYGSMDTYTLEFRVVRFPLSDSSYECIVTNLPADEFPLERVRECYSARWGIETSFRKLKYTIGLSGFHSYKPEYVRQEIWAKLTAYNITETLVSHVVVETRDTKHDYQVNFSAAAHICRVFLRQSAGRIRINVMALLGRELVPIRKGRQKPRKKTAHFRRPRYFTYRAS